jgi:hypothetical protein
LYRILSGFLHERNCDNLPSEADVTIRFLASAILVVFMLACNGEGNDPSTATIRPASPPAGEMSDDDPALTQTTEIGEERSPNEGGVLTNPEDLQSATPVDPLAGTAAPPRR